MMNLAGLGAAVLAAVVIAGCAKQEKVGAGAMGAEEWRNSAGVDKSRLGPTGRGRYWVLEPGHTLCYKDEDGETLVISVLDETRVVDGVMTRVVEEREEKGGKLKEVSRNFMAIDAATGDVYYFGEEVDIYKNGKVESHDGAWMSGVDDARFGLLVPGAGRMGAKHQQEIAPGVAMDRFEVVGVDETVRVGAGAFEHCLHAKETTPLEKGVGHKWYAPGVGLVKDGEMELVRVAR